MGVDMSVSESTHFIHTDKINWEYLKNTSLFVYFLNLKATLKSSELMRIPFSNQLLKWKRRAIVSSYFVQQSLAVGYSPKNICTETLTESRYSTLSQYLCFPSSENRLFNNIIISHVTKFHTAFLEMSPSSRLTTTSC